jgi:hypothetical protein
MKIIFFAITCLIYTSAHAGYFIEKSMYSPNFLVVGRGMSLDEARKDALAAIPKAKNDVHYEMDSLNSPANQCTEGFAPNEDLTSCGAVAWQTSIPLIRVER